jgi:RHS repeat-associated protein
VHTDRLGSTILGTNESGEIKSHIIYDAWGVPTITQQGLLNPNYTGHVWDDILEVYYAKARMYDPQLSRFLAVDPIKGSPLMPQTLNSYLYVLNNPLRYVDPDGHLPSEVIEGTTFENEIFRELRRTGQYPNWTLNELETFSNRYAREVEWVGRNVPNGSDALFLTDKSMAFDMVLGQRLHVLAMFENNETPREVREYFAQAVFCLDAPSNSFLRFTENRDRQTYIASRSGNTPGQLLGLSLMQMSGYMNSFARMTSSTLRPHGSGSNHLHNDIWPQGGWRSTRQQDLRLDLQHFGKSSNRQNKEYTTPAGGGGNTASLTINGQKITVGHGGRHLNGTDLSIAQVNNAIANDVINQTLQPGVVNKFQININGITLEYRAFLLPDGTINIGTYFVPGR